MSVEKARAHYIGRPGYHKLNCAQTIMHAFKDRFNVSEAMVDALAACGGGRAPDGVCGSLYAAKMLLAQVRPQSIPDCEQALLFRAGSIKCKDIRALNKLSCAGCVETIATQIDKIS